jgi:hypothetical protein
MGGHHAWAAPLLSSRRTRKEHGRVSRTVGSLARACDPLHRRRAQPSQALVQKSAPFAGRRGGVRDGATSRVGSGATVPRGRQAHRRTQCEAHQHGIDNAHVRLPVAFQVGLWRAGTSPAGPDIGADQPARLFRRKQAFGRLPPNNAYFVARAPLLPRRGHLTKYEETSLRITALDQTDRKPVPQTRHKCRAPVGAIKCQALVLVPVLSASASAVLSDFAVTTAIRVNRLCSNRMRPPGGFVDSP